MKQFDLISPTYLDEQRRLHADPRGYGQKGKKWAPLVRKIWKQFGLSGYAEASILDYGCGQNSLAEAMEGEMQFDSYDPAVKQYSTMPSPATLVVCADVLEHVEPEKLCAVLDHLAALTERALFVAISTVETEKRLSDGRQAHISLHDSDWWRQRLERRFRVERVFDKAHHKPEKQFVALLIPKGRP